MLKAQPFFQRLGFFYSPKRSLWRAPQSAFVLLQDEG